MGKTNNTIDINGTRYDARTGDVVRHVPGHHTAHQLQSAVKKPTMSDVVRRPASHARPHQPAASHTLMRQAVKKPVPSARKHSPAQSPTDIITIPHARVMPKQSVKQVDPRLLQKAKHVPKSQLIQHFAPIKSSNNQFIVNDIPMPSKSAMARKPSAPSKPTTTNDLLEQALRQATSHDQKPIKHPGKKSSRRLKITSGIAVFLALVGVMGFQQVPNFKLHVASAKAGFKVSMPGYKPAGYTMSKINSSSGNAAAIFQSNSDSRTYSISQKASSWDSAALRDNYVVGHDKNYQAVETAGQTVYLYGDHNATWVNGGIWYVVQSDGSLTYHQLVEIANSL